MNTGAFGEGFPYTNFHALNLDWIIGVIVDFREKYSTIQQAIDNGVMTIEQASEETLTAFQTTAEQIAQHVISTIPHDYTALSNLVDTKLGQINLDLTNTSLNDLTQVGVFDVTNTNIDTITNVPVHTSGMVIVFKQHDKYVQFYATHKGDIYSRFRTSDSTWSDWQCLTATFCQFSVPANSDLNNVRTGGLYRISNADSSTIANMPIVTSGTLQVYNANGAVTQVFCGVWGCYATRYMTSSEEWTAWSVDNREGNVCSWLSTNKVFYRAHQGDKEHAPANSVPAYELACSGTKYDIIQIATPRQSADGTWYVIHDDDLSLTTNGTGNISERHDSYIRNLYINVGNNVEQYTQAQRHIPTLAEVLAIARKYGKQVSIRQGSLPENANTQAEIDTWTSFMNVINKYGFRQCIFSAGNNNKVMRTAQKFGLSMHEYYITNPSTDIRTLFNSAEASNIRNIIWFKDISIMTEAEIKEAHARGYKIAVYHDTDILSEQEADLISGADIIQNSML